MRKFGVVILPYVTKAYERFRTLTVPAGCHSTSDTHMQSDQERTTLPLTTMLRLLVPLLAVLPGLVEAQDIDRGREMAERWCANCHIVASSAKAGRADGLPTFPAIAAKQEITSDSLRGVMTAAHGRMPDFSLSPNDQEALIAYIFSLRQK